MSFRGGLAFTFTESWAFIRKAWWLVPIPIIPYLIFSLAGHYSFVPAQSATAGANLTLGLAGILEIASVYWTMRFLALDQSVAAAISIDRHSARTFGPYLLIVSAFYLGLMQLVPDSLIYALILIASICILAPWSVIAPSGSNAVSPIRAIRAGFRKLPWALIFLTVVTIPFGLLIDFFETRIEGSDGNDWLGAADIVFYSISVGIGLVVLNVATFVIAFEMGVRTGNTERLAHIFD